MQFQASFTQWICYRFLKKLKEIGRFCKERINFIFLEGRGGLSDQYYGGGVVARFGTFWEGGRGLMMRGKGGGGRDSTKEELWISDLLRLESVGYCPWLKDCPLNFRYLEWRGLISWSAVHIFWGVFFSLGHFNVQYTGLRREFSWEAGSHI